MPILRYRTDAGIVKVRYEKHLYHLYLINRQMTELLPSIKRFSKLTKLGLQCNKLTFIPSAIRALKKLVYLSLNDNQIIDVSYIATFSQLQNLQLCYNKIKAIEINTLINLTELYLDHNEITEFPKINALTNLTAFTISYNQLKRLPSEIGKLTNLTELNLSNNQLKWIPLEIGKLTNLTELNLAYNQLIILDINDLINLTALNLNSNRLKFLSNINKLVKLTDLHLNHNQLKFLPYLPPNIETLNIFNNQIIFILKNYEYDVFAEVAHYRYIYYDEV